MNTKSNEKNGRGFTAVAFNRPEVHSRGRVLIVAESTIASQLVDEINTWKDQLVGDGWEIVYKTAAATDTVVSVKNKIASSYNEPGSLKAVILFGHIPVPYSGSMAPDGHSDHGGAWPADIYYADMDGIWTDFSVNSPGSVRPQNRNVPGDGKFDQILAPSVAEFALGRIDMANMPAFAPLTEVELLRRYLQKMTNYRTATFTPIRQGLIDDNFGDFYTEAFARGAWNWMGAIVGRDKTFARDFRSELSTQSYLWAYGCGGGTYTGAGGIGLTSEMATQPLNAVFTALFGSYFGDWDSTDNFLRSPLAADGQALMSVWAGRPNWSFHSMAAGETMTRTILQTWNQPISYYSTSHDNGVHVGFMGDPTLRDYMIKPVTNITTSGKIGNQTTLSWNHTETVTGYYIYKSASRLGPYHLINSTPVTEKSFPLILNNDDKFFMVRGVKPEDTYGGIFQNLSTGTIYELP